MDFDARPILVFWEATRACPLACRHCRASAVLEPPPGELSTDQALAFVDSLTGFGRPHPVLVITGGDAMLRPDLPDLLARARDAHIPVALAPSVTPTLPERIPGLRAAGVKMISISLDGAVPETHEGIRGVPGHFERTLESIRGLRSSGLPVQVNTAVMKENVGELPAVAELVHQLDASVWELFFLVRVGRGAGMTELDPGEAEDVCRFLADASRYDFVVRTVEAPFFRRMVAGDGLPAGALYHRLAEDLRSRLGAPGPRSRAQTKGTRDGKGIVFVSSRGEVSPSGFLPVTLGNVTRRTLVELYRESPLLREIRRGAFSGRCGECTYRDLCGGSRARSFAATGDPLGEDPACGWVPTAATARRRQAA
jgi:AdoMet-dependent heme synthase